MEEAEEYGQEGGDEHQVLDNSTRDKLFSLKYNNGKDMANNEISLYELICLLVTNPNQELSGDSLREVVFGSESFTVEKLNYEAGRKGEMVGKKREEGIIRCKKCKSLKTYTMDFQARSGDEGMSLKCVCHDCGYNWIRG